MTLSLIGWLQNFGYFYQICVVCSYKQYQSFSAKYSTEGVILLIIFGDIHQYIVHYLIPIHLFLIYLYVVTVIFLVRILCLSFFLYLQRPWIKLLLKPYLSFQDGDTIYTASTDKTVGVFDTMTGTLHILG